MTTSNPNESLDEIKTPEPAEETAPKADLDTPVDAAAVASDEPSPTENKAITEESSPSAPSAPVEVPPPSTAKVIETASKAAPEMDGEVWLKNTRENGTPEQKSIIAALDEFCELTAPMKPITPREMYLAQSRLWTTLKAILSIETFETFRKAWNAGLTYFAVHGGDNRKRIRTALSEAYFGRHTYAWERDPMDCIAFQLTMNVMRMTRDPNTRRKEFSSNVKLEQMKSESFTDKMISNLAAFYETN